MPDLRKLALFSSLSSAVAMAGMVPALGMGLSLYVGLSIWAALGFRWWLASIPITIIADSTSLLGTFTVSTATGSAVATVVSHASPQVVQNWAMLQGVFLIGFPLILWFAERDIRKMLLKRLGPGRLP
jgi:hypothetical protein